MLVLASRLGDAATVALAALTFLILLANAALAWATKRAADATQLSAGAAERAAQAAEAEAQASHDQARVAGDQVEVAREQTELARRSVELQNMPVLLDVPLDLSIEEAIAYPGGKTVVHKGGIVVATLDEPAHPHALLSFPVRNVGRGPARVGGGVLYLTTRDGKRVEAPPQREIERDVLPVDERGRIMWWFDSSAAGPDRWEAWEFTTGQYGSISILVRYADLAGGQDTIMHFILAARDFAHYGWAVYQTIMQTPEEAFADAS